MYSLTIQHLFTPLCTLLWDIFVYVLQLEGAAALFALFVRVGAEDKIGILADLLKPVAC
jgi:hypothetical protein